MEPQIDAKCVVCEEVITTPICSKCLKSEIGYWLLDKKPELEGFLLVDTDNFGSNKEYVGTESMNTKCVICGNQMNVCAHCFCNDMKDIIAEQSSEVVDDFGLYFKFA